jgi:hypothetical protein
VKERKKKRKKLMKGNEMKASRRKKLKETEM